MSFFGGKKRLFVFLRVGEDWNFISGSYIEFYFS